MSEIEKLRADNERLRTILRSLISTGTMHPISQALAMNTLDPGSGDAWLAAGVDAES